MENAQKFLDAAGKKAIETQKKRNNAHKQFRELSGERGELSKYNKFIRETKTPGSEEYARAINKQIAHNSLKNIGRKSKALSAKRNNAHLALGKLGSPPFTENNVKEYLNTKQELKRGKSQKFLDLIGRSAKLIKENRNDAHSSLKNIGRKAIKTKINRNNSQNELRHKAFLHDFIKKVNGEISDLKKGNGHSLPMSQVDGIIKKYEEMIEIIKAKHEESDERMEESYQVLLNDFLQTQKKYNDLDENCGILHQSYNELYKTYTKLHDDFKEIMSNKNSNQVAVSKMASIFEKRKKDKGLEKIKENRDSKIKNMVKTISNMNKKGLEKIQEKRNKTQKGLSELGYIQKMIDEDARADEFERLHAVYPEPTFGKEMNEIYRAKFISNPARPSP
jgi:hypothetical protein